MYVDLLLLLSLKLHYLADTDECTSQPCSNGGVCKDGVNEFKCTCPKGTTGKTCSVDIDECNPMPCQNGGLCFEIPNGEFYCSCPTGIFGRFCEES